MPEPAEVTTRKPLVLFDVDASAVPARVYVTLNDRLYIRSRNSLAGVTLRIAGRLLTADGEVVPFNHEHTPATDRSASLSSFQLAEGFLLSAVVFPSAGAPIRGQTFVELGFLRGLDANAAVVDILARDYVAEAEPLAFPGAPVRGSLDGPGAILTVTGSDPAAGADISETVPTDARWRFMSISSRLVTDANVASRRNVWIFDDGTNAYFETPETSSQAASTTERHTLAAVGHSRGVLITRHVEPGPPEMYLAAGDRIRTDVASIQVGDNWEAPQIHIEEWIED